MMCGSKLFLTMNSGPQHDKAPALAVELGGEDTASGNLPRRSVRSDAGILRSRKEQLRRGCTFTPGINVNDCAVEGTVGGSLSRYKRQGPRWMADGWDERPQQLFGPPTSATLLLVRANRMGRLLRNWPKSCSCCDSSRRLEWSPANEQKTMKNWTNSATTDTDPQRPALPSAVHGLGVFIQQDVFRR